MKRISKIIRRANVVYELESFQTGIPHIPLYISNGVIGGGLDHFGFMSRPNTSVPEGRTVLGYVGHYHRAAHGRHIQFPLAIVRACFASGAALNLIDCRSYRQELDLYDGLLRTSYDLYGHTTITSFASQAVPDFLFMRIERENPDPGHDFVITIECETSRCQNNDTSFKVDPVTVNFTKDAGEVAIRSLTNTTETEWFIHCPGVESKLEGTRVHLRLPAGTHDLAFWVKRPDGLGHKVLDLGWDGWLARHCEVWHEFWEKSWVNFPEERALVIWCRMKYYALSTFPPVTERPPCPTGLLGNIWGFTFPQDVYYIAENLPRLGHFERARVSLEWWLKVLPEVEAYGKRLLGVEGAYYPWTPPYKDFDQYETDGVTGADSYELHNPAYVAAMVWHYYLRSGDRDFLNRFFTIMERVFRFYANILTKSSVGTYDSFHEKARGQDEASTTDGNLRNLLCVSYSAEYTAHAYLQAAEIIGGGEADLLERARDLVAHGCTRAPLLRPEGYYRTYEGDNRPPGNQKHPVQLNPIAYLPLPEMVDQDPAVTCAWRNRYELTIEAKKPLTLGWTLGEFALASVRMRSAREFERDLRAIQPCRGADPRWIQFYESSFWEGWHLMKSYYFPMMGLYLQAFTDCLVQDWRGYLDLFACLLPGWEEKRIQFAGIRTNGGVEVSGRWHKGRWVILLSPYGAKTVRVRISRDEVTVGARGQASGPKLFEGNEVVEFVFEDGREIVLRGMRKNSSGGAEHNS